MTGREKESEMLTRRTKVMTKMRGHQYERVGHVHACALKVQENYQGCPHADPAFHLLPK